MKEFSLFSLTSGLSFFLNNSINFVLVEVCQINIKLSALISYTFLFFLNYFIFKKYIFTNNNRGHKSKLTLLNYIKLNITLRILEYISYILITNIYTINYLIILNIVSLFFTFFKFFFLRKMTL